LAAFSEPRHQPHNSIVMAAKKVNPRVYFDIEIDKKASMLLFFL
jgi:hypothetical protein